MTTVPQSLSLQFTDKTITCVQCGRNFVFTAREQLRHVVNDFQDPKRCKPCREERRRQNEQTHGARR
jgi:hypothetical protein